LASTSGRKRQPDRETLLTPRPITRVSDLQVQSGHLHLRKEGCRSPSCGFSSSSASSRADKGPATKAAPSGTQRPGKYVSRASFGRRLAAGPFSPRSPGVCQRRV
jgi:hypothetical protein